MKPLQFPNWQQIRNALEHAYAELGLEMEQITPNSKQYPPDHWNIAGKVWEFITQNQGKCIQCSTPLSYYTVIRCADCKATLCERCAPVHFGPNHAARALAAHQ